MLYLREHGLVYFLLVAQRGKHFDCMPLFIICRPGALLLQRLLCRFQLPFGRINTELELVHLRLELCCHRRQATLLPLQHLLVFGGLGALLLQSLLCFVKLLFRGLDADFEFVHLRLQLLDCREEGALFC
jgi:hypothetical protein